jgi:hypothetical protein
MKESLDLLQNASDSLNEALRRIAGAGPEELRPYKFAVLHFSHALELIFKHHVAAAHPLLIYKNPFSKSIHKEQTIGLWEAVQFLKNEGHELSEEMIRDLEWIKKLRNDIEHYKFEMDAAEARRIIGRLIRALDKFSSKQDLIILDKLIDPECIGIFNVLNDEYKASLAEAKQRAVLKSGGKQITTCYMCGETDTAYEHEGEMVCMFCGEKEQIVDCSVCGIRVPMTFASVWNDDHPGVTDYICDACHDHIMSKD